MTDSWRNSPTVRTASAPTPFRARIYVYTRAYIRIHEEGDTVGDRARDNSRWSQGVRRSASARVAIIPSICTLSFNLLHVSPRHFETAKLQQRSTLYLSLLRHTHQRISTAARSEGFNSGP
ncbi:hypothetical protein DBV15_03773 [Temnothorax longispinosus]|uniref:Uncharacterized protein n=1 Tax=Temnothorax longispinosus TaxID=300112 RepID=A0A4S2KR98_9HYME|nr:hypothetical protein DBV15_03773 [Temnothorax longispinosus]